MKVKKIPMRSCVVTHEKCAKADLVRVVRTPDGNVVVDSTGKMNGRGAYLKKDLAVFEKAKKSKVLDRILEIDVNEEVYENLNNLVK